MTEEIMSIIKTKLVVEGDETEEELTEAFWHLAAYYESM